MINLSANMFVFVDLNVHHKDWLNYAGGTDRPRELCYSFSIYLTPMVNIHNQIPAWNYSDHIFVSVSIDFLPKSKTGCPFHHIAQYYSHADWGDCHNHLRDVP